MIKHLFPVEDVDLCKRLEAEGLIGEDGKYRFVHQSVQDVYDELNVYYERYMGLREEIRQIEKMARLQRLEINLSSLRTARMQIEANFMSLFEAVCQIGDQGRNVIRRTCELYANRLEAELDTRSVRHSVGHQLEQFREYVVHD